MDKIVIFFCSAIAFFLANGAPDVGLLLWLAPFPLLLLAFDSGAIWVAAVSFCSYFVGITLGTYSYDFKLGLGRTGIIAINALFFAFIILISRYAMKKWRSLFSVFIFPIFWVTYCYLFSVCVGGSEIHIPLGSQIHFTWIIQILSITGVWGLLFLIGALSSGFAFGISLWTGYRTQALLAMTIPLALLILVLGFGHARISQSSLTNKITVGLTGKNIEKSHTDSPKQYVDRIKALAKRGAKYVLQSECSLSVEAEEKNKTLSMIQNAAEENGVFVFAALELFEKHRQVNGVVAFDSNGKRLDSYKKQHTSSNEKMGFQSGKQIAVIDVHGKIMGIAIGQDMDLSRIGREYGQAGAGILFVPACEYYANISGEQHMASAIFQSVANGFALARTASYGYLSVSDSFGNIIAKKATEEWDDAYLVATVTLGQGKTLYARWGDWFAWISVILSIFVLIKLARR